MDGIIKVTRYFYFLVLRNLLFIGCVESNPGPMVKGIDYKQNLCEEVSLMQFSLKKKLQEEIYEFQEENNKLKISITLTKANIPNQETTGRWNNSQDRKIPGLDREIASALKNGEWMKCIEIIRKNIPADDTVYKKIQTNAMDPDECLPLVAAGKGYVELIQVLLCNGLNVNERMGQSGQTMLHSAAKYGNNNIVELLLCTGADIKVRNIDRWTALHSAAWNGHVNIVQILIDKGADINSRNNIGWTSLHYAAWNGHVSTVKILIENGADINSRNNYGWTPLHWAAEKGHVSVLKCLLDNNCNREIQNNDGKTELDIARGKGYSNIVRLLLDK